MEVIIKESYKSNNKEQQGIFLHNGTHTIRTVWQCTDTQVYSYMVNYKSLQ
jgi:hypothetical protein